LIATCRAERTGRRGGERAPGAGESNATVRGALVRITARIASTGRSQACARHWPITEPGGERHAIRGWPSGPQRPRAPDLLALRRSAESPVHKVLALRGYHPPGDYAAGYAGCGKRETAGGCTEVVPPERTKEAGIVRAGRVEASGGTGISGQLLIRPQSSRSRPLRPWCRSRRTVQRTQPEAAAAAVRKVLEVCTAPAARQVAESSLIVLDTMANIAPQRDGDAVPGFEKDGTASGDPGGDRRRPATLLG